MAETNVVIDVKAKECSCRFRKACPVSALPHLRAFFGSYHWELVRSWYGLGMELVGGGQFFLERYVFCKNILYFCLSFEEERRHFSPK